MMTTTILLFCSQILTPDSIVLLETTNTNSEFNILGECIREGDDKVYYFMDSCEWDFLGAPTPIKERLGTDICD